MKHPALYRALPIFFILGVLFAQLPSTAWANVLIDAKQWNLTADKMIREDSPPLLVAEGNVLLEKKEPVIPQAKIALKGGHETPKLKTVTTVRADRVAYDFTKGTLEATGNLEIHVGPDVLSADSGVIDLNTASGRFTNATILSHEKELHFEGRLIEKTGERTYHIEDGWVVTCKLQPGQVPPWSFAAADTDITDGGYALLKHATFRIKDIPVFYTPVMLLPAKRKRQTGLLFPSMSLSDTGGFSLETPFFINLSPSSDLTLYPRYFADRGLMLGAEYRYVLSDESRGMFMAHYLDDDLSDPSETSYYADSDFTHTNPDRYWFRGKVDQNIGPWVTRLDLDVVSDLDYLSEFTSGSTGFSTNQTRFLDVFGRGFIDESNRYRENTLGALRSWDNGTALLAELSAINDVSDTVYTADDPSLAWKLPSLTYTGLLPVWNENGPDFSWAANYTSFWRDKGVEGQRIDLMPTITAGIPISPYIESYVSGSVRNTSYLIEDNGASQWQNSDSKNRFLYTLNGEVGTTLARDFSVDFDEFNGVTHTLRPYLAYSYTEIPDEKAMPQFDWVDDLEEENTLYLGINNFFSISGVHNGRSFDRQYAYLKIKQGYDLRSTEKDSPLTPIEAETGWYPAKRMRVKYTTKFDVYGDGAFYHSIDSDFTSSRGDTLSLDYRYNELTDVNSVKGSVWYFLPYNFAAGYALERNIEDNDTIEETIRVRYMQPCWSVELSSHSESGDQSFMLTFRLANIGNPFGFDFTGQ
ncbi:LPS-assembly protein LptD [Desulfobulbus rhabdoformis]|uniref:LPS assembly protein LptD n=1 Tax=Desulfobulbus rhabdoformis TaxID=34032 RepID=UPI0019635D33|nr:LPS-assembly protein LptD [Desulfobulbus rhabdoformis]